MNTTTKTSEQIAADFEAVFKAIMPKRPVRKSAAERLEPYRKEILRQHRRGLTWAQIAAGMADPLIGVKVSQKILRNAFAGKSAESAAKAARMRLILDPATGERIVAAPAPTTPTRQRLILDRATGKPISPPPAA